MLYDMVSHMKTTVDIANPLLEEAKRLSDKEKTTLRALIEEGLWEVITKRKSGGEVSASKGQLQRQRLKKKIQGESWDKIRSAAYLRPSGRFAFS